MQECTLIKEYTNMLCSFENTKTLTYKNIWKNENISKMPLGSNLPPPPPPLFFSSYSWGVSIAFNFCFQAKTNWKHAGKIPEQIHRKNFFRLDTNPPALFLVLIHDLLSLHFILVQANEYWKIPEKTGNLWEHIPEKKTSRLEATFPA